MSIGQTLPNILWESINNETIYMNYKWVKSTSLIRTFFHGHEHVIMNAITLEINVSWNEIVGSPFADDVTLFHWLS